MKIVADFHIHSRFSRATSKSLNLELLDKTAHTKGVHILGTGDFTHPLWFRELTEELEEAEPGLYKRKGSNFGTRFVLTCEVSSIYSKGGKVRKIHTLLIAPSLKVVADINKKLGKVGNIASDGRPILGLDVKELTKIALDSSEDCLVIPAHAWTPWFSVFGSKSGFDSLEECFEEMTPFIYAIETGLSSDPAMNWRLSSLDDITLISNSDCHSAPRIAREANVFNAKLDYYDIADTIKTKDKNKFLYTIEFFPQEGKYHFDGHRNCSFSTKPGRIKDDICPVCSRKLTVGTLSRVEELADRKEGVVPKNAIEYKNLIQLDHILSDVFSVGPNTKTVAKEYAKLIKELGTELDILMDIDLGRIGEVSGEFVEEAIKRMRESQVKIIAGYDGEYGKISLFADKEREKYKNNMKQKPLL